MMMTAQKDNDIRQIKALLKTVFGENYREKSSYALRRGVDPVKGLSFVFRHDGDVLGTIGFWPAYLQDLEKGHLQKILFLGPLAVSPLLQGQGIGASLLRKGLSAARFQGHQRVMLVGEPRYYAKVGFKQTLPNSITMPNGQDADRMMVMDLWQKATVMPNLPKLGTLVPYAPLMRAGDMAMRVPDRPFNHLAG